MNKFITTDGTNINDGFGSQFQCYLVTYAIARHLNCEFKYTDMRLCGHVNDIEKEYLNKMMKDIFNSEQVKKNDNLKILNLQKNSPYIEALKKSITNGVLLRASSGALSWDTNILQNGMVDIRANAKKIMYNRLTNNEKKLFERIKGNPVLHVRRGDVDESMPERWISKEIYSKIRLSDYDSSIESNSLIILSESKGYDIENIDNLTIIPLLDASFPLSCLVAIEAKLFFTAKSSYSYSIALLCEPTKVIYTPFWLAPLPSWRTFEPDTSNYFYENEIKITTKRSNRFRKLVSKKFIFSYAIVSTILNLILFYR